MYKGDCLYLQVHAIAFVCHGLPLATSSGVDQPAHVCRGLMHTTLRVTKGQRRSYCLCLQGAHQGLPAGGQGLRG